MADMKWRDRQDVDGILREMGVEVRGRRETTDGDLFLVKGCPFHGGDSEFTVRANNGFWNCHTKCGNGHLEKLYAVRMSMAEEDAYKELRGRVSEETAQQPVLPDGKKVEEWARNLLTGDGAEARDYLERHAISEKLWEHAHIGMANERLRFPVLDVEGRITNVKTVPYRDSDNSNKMSVRFAKMIAYPLWLVADYHVAGRPLVICEGEPDCLALLSIGVNAITTTGGCATLRTKHFPAGFIPTGEGSEVIICFDNDDPGKKAEAKMRNDLRKIGVAVIRTVKLEQDKDISDYLYRHSTEERITAWEALVAACPVATGPSIQCNGVFTADGCVWRETRSGEMRIATFTGKIIEQGLILEGGVSTGRSYVVELTHKDGRHLTVTHEQGAKFEKEIAATPGGTSEWQLHPKDADDMWMHIQETTGGDYTNRDTGWLWGFPSKECKEFFTPDVLYDDDNPKANTKMRMVSEHNILDEMKLPHPDPRKVREGVELLWESAYRSHYPDVMAPIIVGAILAPVRRLLAPQQSRFLMFVRGQTMACKTTRVKVGQSLYGDFWNHQSLLSWSSTPLSVERVLEAVGDASIVVDDLQWEAQSEMARQQIMRVLHSVAQGTGRGRLDQTGKLRTSQAGHSIPVVTCEQLPAGDQSLLARSLIIDVPRLRPGPGADEWKIPHDRTMDKRHLLPYVMSGWINWCMRLRGEVEDRFTNLFRECERKVGEVFDEESINWRNEANNMHRVWERVSLFSATLHLFADWCRDVTDGMDEMLHDEITETWDGRVVRTLFNVQSDALSEGGVANEMVAEIEANIAAGKATLLDEHTGHLVPNKASHNAITIGYLKPISGTRQHPDYESNAVEFQGSLVAVCLNAGTAKLWSNKLWIQIKKYLIQNEMAVDRKTSGPRVLICKPELAKLLLAAVERMHRERWQKENRFTN